MVSYTSSRSSSPEPCRTIQIFVKTVQGDTVPMTVPQDMTIESFRSLLSTQTLLAADDFRLVYAGKHLSNASSTLADMHIQRESTIHLVVPMRGGMPPKKIRCTYKECKTAAQRIIGDCGFCSGHYCEKHRLLEDHKCDGLEDCKKESYERNAAQLNAERTTVIKGI